MAIYCLNKSRRGTVNNYAGMNQDYPWARGLPMSRWSIQQLLPSSLALVSIFLFYRVVAPLPCDENKGPSKLVLVTEVDSPPMPGKKGRKSYLGTGPISQGSAQ